jgi:predicted nicotinamide N-methyase
MTIASYESVLGRVVVDGEPIALWQVADLERYVDRVAALSAADPAEPPYWAHLWSGARVLAAAVPRGARRVIEIGCGLGLPGLVAARRGASVVFVDRERAPLAFVRASARANALARPACVVADFTRAPLRATFDLVLAAEVLYDRCVFEPLARTIGRLLAPGGVALVTDGRRMDTRAFYPALEAAGLGWRARDVRVVEEGVAVDVALVEVRAR